MKYLNKYATTAAYTADTNRPAAETTVSLIQDGTGVKFDGKNVLVEKAGAEVGDICVYNKTLLRKQFIKLDTYNAATFPANLVIVGICFYKNNYTVFIIPKSINTVLYTWGVNIKAKLSGFDFSTGGTFSITTNVGTTSNISYSNTDNLTTVAALVKTALNSGASGFTDWKSDAYITYNCIVIERVVYANSVNTVSVNDASMKVTSVLLCQNRTGTLSGLKSEVNITRNDMSVHTRGGIYYEKLYQWAYASGDDTATNQVVGATGNPVRYSRYNITDNPIIVNYYGVGENGYANYIRSKMIKYPYSKNANTDLNGKQNTEFLASKMYTDIDGALKPEYPLAYNAKQYGVVVSGHITGLETGVWWLPSIMELYWIFNNLKLDKTDKINRALFITSGEYLLMQYEYGSSSEQNNNLDWYCYLIMGQALSYGKHMVKRMIPITSF